jgi:4-hydroxybenzoate polyprenyltransferase
MTSIGYISSSYRDREIDREVDRETERQTEREMVREIEREMEREREKIKVISSTLRILHLVHVHLSLSLRHLLDCHSLTLITLVVCIPQ